MVSKFLELYLITKLNVSIIFKIEVKMNAKIIKISIIIILSFNFLLSSSITESTANDVALNLIEERTDLLNISISNIESYLSNGEKIFYIVHYLPKGFSLIAADNKVKPIIGYSFDNNFNIEDLPIQLDSLLSNYTKNLLFSTFI